MEATIKRTVFTPAQTAVINAISHCFFERVNLDIMKKFLTFILFVFLPLLTNAVTVEINGICYNLDQKSGVAEVTRNTSQVYTDTIVIPEKVLYEDREYTVTSIGAQAFFESRVTSVIFPQSITSIGDAAFAYCQALDSIAIPNKVTVIDHMLFADCEALRRVILPDGVTVIGNSAFNGCFSLDSLNLPNSVESIEDWAFTLCQSLSYIEIPTSLRQIGKGNFSGCSSLQSVLIPDLASWCNIYFADQKANPLWATGRLVLNGEEITDLVIPEEVTSIGNYAFAPCSHITSLTIGDKVTSIGSYAFSSCNLTSVTCYPRQVPHTGTRVFNNDAIEECVLYVAGSAVNEYEKTEPWSNFKEIVSLAIPTHQLLYYVDNVLYKSYTLEEGEYITPEPALEKEGYLFSGWSEIPETMPAHDVIVTGSFELVSQMLLLDGIYYKLWQKTQTADVSDATDSFNGHLNIPVTVTLGGMDFHVTNIADSAFIGCEHLVSVRIPESITHIGKEAFTGCLLQNVFTGNTDIQLEANSFSQATYNHSMLYVPVGKWFDAVFYGDLWRFINIREAATKTEELSFEQAYTLMDAKDFCYVVYDVVNDAVKTQNTFYQIEESSPNNSWQFVKLNGKYGLYNIGAKRYALFNPDGKISLSNTPVPLDLTNGKNGIVIGSEVTTSWNLVLNDKVSIDLNVKEYASGDVNGDGTTDLTDAIMIVYYSLGQVQTGFIESATDVNNDGIIDLTDAIIVVYKSLGVEM